MYKPPIFNRYIHHRMKDEENLYLTNKLHKVKAAIDSKCPESFTYYKSNLKKNKTLTNVIRGTEVVRQNRILVEKIIDIQRNKHLNDKAPFQLPDRGKFKQNDVRRVIEQENIFLTRKIQAAKAYYNNKKLKDDFNKSLNYKKNICEFPVIDFDRPVMTGSSFNRSKNYDINNSSINKSKYYDSGSPNTKRQSDKYETQSGSPGRKNKGNSNTKLFNKNMFIDNYGYCNVEINLEAKDKFVITLKHLASMSGTQDFQLIFYRFEDIAMIKNSYYNFNQFMEDISFSSLDKKFSFKNTYLNDKFELKKCGAFAHDYKADKMDISDHKIVETNQEESMDRGSKNVGGSVNHNEKEKEAEQKCESVKDSQNDIFKNENFNDIEERDDDYLDNKFEKDEGEKSEIKEQSHLIEKKKSEENFMAHKTETERSQVQVKEKEESHKTERNQLSERKSSVREEVNQHDNENKSEKHDQIEENEVLEDKEEHVELAQEKEKKQESVVPEKSQEVVEPGTNRNEYIVKEDENHLSNEQHDSIVEES